MIEDKWYLLTVSTTLILLQFSSKNTCETSLSH